jgi:four helix bundle protein
MSKISSFRELIVWQKAMVLAREVHVATLKFPKDEIFGLTQQVRRATVSIPSNIAEGNGRATRPDYVHFLHVARGSLFEAETQLELSRDFGYLPDPSFQTLLSLCIEIERMLNSIITKLSS